MKRRIGKPQLTSLDSSGKGWGTLVGYYERKQDLGKTMLYLEKIGNREFNEELARIIRDYWWQRNSAVDVSVRIQETDARKQPIWIIRSDMVDGVPRCAHKSTG
jgi:hypothetical protein